MFQIIALEKHLVVFGTQALDDPMDNSGEQIALVSELVIERALRDACDLGDGYDADRAVPLAQKQFRRHVQDFAFEKRRLLTRRATAARPRLPLAPCSFLYSLTSRARTHGAVSVSNNWTVDHNIGVARNNGLRERNTGVAGNNWAAVEGNNRPAVADNS